MNGKNKILANNEKNCYLRDLTPEERTKLSFVNSSLYAELIKEFRNMDKSVQKVEIGSERMGKMYIGLRRTIERLRIADVEVRSHKGEIFLRKKENVN